MDIATRIIIPLVLGYGMDRLLGDPDSWPHPVRAFGTVIAAGERWLNRGRIIFLKGALLTIVLCITTFYFFHLLMTMMNTISPILYLCVATLFVFYGLANQQLIKEGQQVFRVLQNEGIEPARLQLSRIVGRDTTRLSGQQVRTAVLETMSENLADGVIAPLFYYALAGIPGMMTYKMINTLDSMIGYRNERYERFGKFAARLDDVVNFLPARITAMLMVLITASRRGFQFMLRYGHQHKSPNAGYPEAALAGILNVQFGGPNVYHGVLIEKPFIGANSRAIVPGDMQKTSSINQWACICMIMIIIVCSIIGIH